VKLNFTDQWNKLTGKAQIEKINVSVFYHFLFTYMIIMAIPILLALVVFDQASKRLSSETDTAYAYKLEKIANDLDQQWNQMVKIAVEIARNPKLSPHQLNENAFYQIEAVEEMKKYKSELLLADGLIFIDKSSNEIYSDSGKYNKAIYYQYVAELHPEFELVRMIDKTNIPFVSSYPINASKNSEPSLTIAYIFPISAYNLPEKTGVVVFFISKQALITRINNLVGEIGGISIFDKNQQLLTRWGEIENKHVSDKIFKASSKETQFEIAMSPDPKVYAQNISSFKRWVMLLLSISLTLCILVAVILAIFVFSPIRKINHLLKKLMNHSAKTTTKNEFNNINMAIASSIANQHTLTTEIHEQKSRLKHYVLTNLLYRNVTQDILKHCKEAGIELQGPEFGVIVVAFHASDNLTENMTKDQIITELERNSHSSMQMYALDVIHHNYVVAICNVSTGGSKTYYKTAEDILVQSGWNCIGVRLGLGSLVTEMKEINTSFLDAVSAIERVEFASQSIVRFDDTIKRETYLWYPTQAYMRLTQSIKLGDEVLALEHLMEVQSVIQQKSSSIMMQKLRCMDFMSTLLKFLDDLDLVSKQHDSISIMLYGEPQEIFQMAEEFVRNACRYIYGKKQENINQLSQAMMDYVHQHVLDPQFGLEILAEQCQLSVPTTSKLFKEHCGYGFKEYVIKLRMDHAKRLLLEGEKSIAEICELAGYNSEAQFFRTFKKVTGLTPSQFKALQNHNAKPHMS
jgi:AraC-like DNA-binding protein